MPVSRSKASPKMWAEVPLPEWAARTFPGFALAYWTNSARVLAGKPAFTVNVAGEYITFAMGTTLFRLGGFGVVKFVKVWE